MLLKELNYDLYIISIIHNYDLYIFYENIIK